MLPSSYILHSGSIKRVAASYVSYILTARAFLRTKVGNYWYGKGLVSAIRLLFLPYLLLHNHANSSNAMKITKVKQKGFWFDWFFIILKGKGSLNICGLFLLPFLDKSLFCFVVRIVLLVWLYIINNFSPVFCFLGSRNGVVCGLALKSSWEDLIVCKLCDGGEREKHRKMLWRWISKEFFHTFNSIICIIKT